MRQLGGVRSPGRRGYLIGAAVGLWVLAMVAAIYVSSTPDISEVAMAKPQTEEERRHAEVRAKLAERTEFRELESRAESGDVSAMVRIAGAYSKGSMGATEDPAKALSLYQRAAAKGSVRAMVALAEMFEEGRGADKDMREAVVWYEQAANRNSLRAARRLATLYFEGSEVPRDDAAAFRWWQRVAEAGDDAARLHIAHMYEHGRGVARDLTAAFFAYARVAESGEPEAQTHVAWMLATGRGVPVDTAEAARWYAKAADQDHMPAVANLGIAKVFGRGVDRDVDEGLRLLERAKEAGDSQAMVSLAQLRANGLAGLKRDSDAAAELLRQAAALDNVEAKASLAALQIKSDVPLEATTALGELQKLANSGVTVAKTLLAYAYLNGVSGVSADWVKARALAQQASEEGFAPARTLYGAMLRNGIGGPRDVRAAMKELTLAADSKDPSAMAFLASILASGDPQLGIAPNRILAAKLVDEAKATGFSHAEALKDAMTDKAGELSASTNQAIPPSTAVDDAAQFQQPVVLHREEPKYPVDLRTLGITGTVTVDFIVDTEGKVVNAFALNSSLPGFEAPAVTAVTQWRFRPATKGGKPVNTHLQVPIIFVLNEEVEAKTR